MNCQGCSKFCHCTCGTTETRTEIILYPVCQQAKKNFRNPRRKCEKDQLRQSLAETQKQQSFSRSTRITETIDSVSKIGMSSSLFLNPKSKIKLPREFELDTISQNKGQNKENDRENIEENDAKTMKRNSLCSSLVSPFTSQRSFNAAAPTIRSGDITIKLLARENDQLKDELQRLRKEEKQLIEFQIACKTKNSRQLSLLKDQYQDIQRRSSKRQGQLMELKNLLSIAKYKKKRQEKSLRKK